LPEESFDFLGYTIGRCYLLKDGRAFIGTRSSRKRIGAICQSISQMTRPAFRWKAVEEMVEDLNRTLRGWGNYFCLGAVSRAYRAVDNHARHRLRQWMNGKERSRGVNAMRHALLYLHRELVLLRLAPKTANRKGRTPLRPAFTPPRHSSTPQKTVESRCGRFGVPPLGGF